MTRKVRGVRDKCPPGYVIGRPANAVGDAAPEFIPMSEVAADTGPPYNDEKAQDAVGGILTDTATIDFTYNDAVPSITADLKNTTVTPGTYGSTTQAPVIAIDSTGRITSASNATITPTAASTSFTPYDHIAATNVQAAIQEVVDEFVSKVRTGTETMAAALTTNGAGFSVTPAIGSAGAYNMNVEGNVGCNVFIQNFRAAASSPILSIRHARGTRASPAALNTNDQVFNFAGQGQADASTAVAVFNMLGTVIAATPSATDMQGRVVMQVCAAGAVSATDLIRMDHTNGFSMFGANIVIDASRHFRLRTYTTATLPTASPANQFAIVSDDAVFGVVPIFSDNTNWRRVCDRQIVGAASRLVPSGGTTGQALKKNSNTDFDLVWGGVGASTFITLTDAPASYAGKGLYLVRVNAGETAVEFVAPTSSGVTVRGAYFKGATGNPDTASTAAFATKGIIFTPDVNMHVTAIVAFIDGAATSENHHAQIASLSGNTTAATVVASIGTSPTVTTATTNMRSYRFIFSSPLALVAGTSYLIAAVNASGAGTTVLRMGASAALSNNGWDLNAPGKTEYVTMSYNTINVSAAQAASASGSDAFFNIWIEGTTD